jgi:hypothetical protein
MGMYKPQQCYAPLATALLCFANCVAMASDKVAITITNNDTDDVKVNVYDMNTTPRSKLLSRQNISGFAAIPLSVTADANGSGHVRWTAVTTDPQLHKCGRKDRPGLADGASVHVYAKSVCRTK